MCRGQCGQGGEEGCVADEPKSKKQKGRKEEASKRPEKEEDEAGWFLHLVFSFTTDHKKQTKEGGKKNEKREKGEGRKGKKGNPQAEDEASLSRKVLRGERGTRFSRRSSIRERTVSWASKRLVPMMPEGPLLHQPATYRGKEPCVSEPLTTLPFSLGMIPLLAS